MHVMIFMNFSRQPTKYISKSVVKFKKKKKIVVVVRNNLTINLPLSKPK